MGWENYPLLPYLDGGSYNIYIHIRTQSRIGLSVFIRTSERTNPGSVSRVVVVVVLLTFTADEAAVLRVAWLALLRGGRA